MGGVCRFGGVFWRVVMMGVGLYACGIRELGDDEIWLTPSGSDVL